MWITDIKGCSIDDIVLFLKTLNSMQLLFYFNHIENLSLNGIMRVCHSEWDSASFYFMFALFANNIVIACVCVCMV